VRSVRGSQQYASPPNINLSLKQAELQKIQQHRQHLLLQLNQLQNIENELVAPPLEMSYSEEDVSVDEAYQPGASYEQLMNSLPPPNSSIAQRKLMDPNEYAIREQESYAPAVQGDIMENVESHNNSWESKSMSLRPSQRPPQQRERFATVSTPTGYSRPPTGLVLTNESILP
jgi:hypothetical protein